MLICRNLDTRLLAAMLVGAARRYADNRASDAGPPLPSEPRVLPFETGGQAWPENESRDVRAP